MKHLVKSLASILVLGVTGVLLVADSAEKCPHARQSASFSITSGCGPAGTFSIEVREDMCGFTVSGAESLQLPDQGRFWPDADNHMNYDLVEGTWHLTGERTYDSASLADAGWPSDAGAGSVPASRECIVSHEEDGMKLRCTDRAQAPSDPEPRVLSTCEATLTPQ